jgi:Raf kinase inhibitor-like YbhB/YbcL family protein
MRKLAVAAAAVVTLALAGAAARARDLGRLAVASPAFGDQSSIPSTFTCDGKGVSPPVTWSDPPPLTRSLAVVIDDPDAPNGDFAHLLVYNLPPDTRSLPPGVDRDNVLPAGATLGTNSAHAASYAPICPPHGVHHYRVRVLALDQAMPQRQLELRELLDNASGHVLARGELDGVYGRGR